MIGFFLGNGGLGIARIRPTLNPATILCLGVRAFKKCPFCLTDRPSGKMDASPRALGGAWPGIWPARQGARGVRSEPLPNVSNQSEVSYAV
jgi:hypothetical protein